MPDLLNVSLSGLRAYQGALSTTSHNIANVGNDSYTRQRVELDARNPIGLGNSYFGQGVDLTSVDRIIDNFNTMNIRDLTANTSRLEAFADYASRIESMVADQDAGLMPALNGFFNAVSDVANDPSASAPRVAMLGAAENLQQRLSSMGEELQRMESEVNSRLRSEITEINQIAEQIAKLNTTIPSRTDVDNRPSDLLDKRDALLKQLAEKISVTVVEQANGNLNVLVGSGQLLITNGTALNLVAGQDPAQPSRAAIAIESGSSSVNITQNLVGGTLGGLLDFRDNLLQDTQNRLGRTAIGIAQSVNALQVQGYDLNGELGENLFSSVPMGPLQGQFGGDYLANGFDVGDTVAFDLDFDGQTVAVSYAVQPGDTNQDIADGLLASINADGNVTDNGDGTYTLAGTTPGSSLTFELYGSNIKFISAGGPSPLGHNLQLSALTDGVADDARIQLANLGSSSTQLTAALAATGSAASFVGPSTEAIANLENSGTGVLNYVVNDAAQLSVSDYEVTYDGANYNVVRLGDNTTVASGAGPFNVDGLDISVSGTPNAGDSFMIRPTNLGAINMRSNIIDPNKLAMALPVRAQVSAANIGSTQASQAEVLDVTNGDLTRAVDLVFTRSSSAVSFDVIDRQSGTVLQNAVPYYTGMTVSQNGWQIQLDGQPATGDTVSVENNGNAASDNRNALAMANLQLASVLDGGNTTFEQSYNSLVSQVGVLTQQVNTNLEVDTSLLNSAQARRESISGVNLDEEAADLIRYQQAYQALSRIVQTSQTLFESLLSVV